MTNTECFNNLIEIKKNINLKNDKIKETTKEEEERDLDLTLFDHYYEINISAFILSICFFLFSLFLLVIFLDTGDADSGPINPEMLSYIELLFYKYFSLSSTVIFFFSYIIHNSLKLKKKRKNKNLITNNSTLKTKTIKEKNILEEQYQIDLKNFNLTFFLSDKKVSFFNNMSTTEQQIIDDYKKMLEQNKNIKNYLEFGQKELNEEILIETN